MAGKSTRFFFPNERGNTLAGIIDMPERIPAFYAVFGPCFTCVKESHAAFKIGRALAARGIATLRFDTTGVGESGGALADTNFTTRVLDIVAAARALTAEREAPRLIIGHSMSGTAAISAAKYLPDTRAIATLGSPSDPASVIEKFRRQRQMEERGDTVVIDVLGKETAFRSSFIDDMLSQNVPEDTAYIAQKLFIFHAPQDAIVSFDNAETLLSRSGTKGELVPLSDKATHLLEKGNEDAEFIAGRLADWLRPSPRGDGPSV